MSAEALTVCHCNVTPWELQQDGDVASKGTSEVCGHLRMMEHTTVLWMGTTGPAVLGKVSGCWELIP